MRVRGVVLCLVFALLGFAGVGRAQYQTVKGGVEDLKWKVGTFSRASRLSAGGTVSVHGMTPVNVLAYGVDNTGATVATDSIKALCDSVRVWGGGTLYFPPGTYLHDGTLLPLYSNMTIIGDDATFRLQAGSYSSNVYFWGTRTDVAYSADTTYVQNVVIDGIKIDGNISNVTTTASSNGITAHMVKDFAVRDCSIYDMPGTTGGGYGISFWYSDRVRIENTYVSRTDRQNILVWETQNAVIDGCSLRDSYYRGCILVSTMSPATYQESYATIVNTSVSNALSGGVNRGIRFSGQGMGVIDNCVISNCDSTGIAILDVYYKDVKVSNTRIVGNSEGVRVQSTTDKVVRFYNCEIDSNTYDAVYVSSANGSVQFSECRFVGNGGRVVVEYADNILFADNHVSGGTYVSIRPGKYARIRGNVFTGLTNSSYAVLLGGDSSLVSFFDDNVLYDNAIDKVYSLQSGRLYGNTLDAVATGNMEATFNVRDFGATGDGTTDDTAAIQAAIDACEAAGGGEVYFPAGAYSVDSLTVNGAVKLYGSGTIAKQAGTTVGIHIMGAGTVIDGLTFDAASTSGQPNTEIKLGDGSSEIRIVNCKFSGSTYCAISAAPDSLGGYGSPYTTPAEGVIISNNVFDGDYARDVYLHSVNNITISDNVFTGCDYDAIRLRENDGEVVISNNQFYDIGDPAWPDSQTRDAVDAYYSGYKLVIEGNVIDTVAMIGLDIKGVSPQNTYGTRSVVIDGNHISKCRYSGIVIYGGSESGSAGETEPISGFVVSNNVVSECNLENKTGGGSVGDAGIYVKGLARNGVISGNVVYGVYGRGIAVQNMTAGGYVDSGISVTGNTVYNNGLSSATTGIGLYINTVNGLSLIGNVATNDTTQANPYQYYGIYVDLSGQSGYTVTAAPDSATMANANMAHDNKTTDMTIIMP